jgi:histidinol-phosphatase (PHP family)
MRRLSDFHVHPDYSIDALGSIRQYCDRALEIGLKSICFTTHYDINPRRIELDGFWKVENQRVRISETLIQKYFKEIQSACEYFYQFGLSVFAGLEIDYYPGVEKEVARLRATFPVDFLIGSVHCLDNIAISDKKEAPSYFCNRTLDEMADDYFEMLLRAASFSGFDCLGHLDYYIRYGRDYYGDAIDRIDINRFDPIFSALVNSGEGIEINTSQFKHGLSRFHPSEDIIARATKAGVRIVSIGSDAHKPSQLGLGIPEADELLRTLGAEAEILLTL